MMEPGLWGSDEGGLVSRSGGGMVSDMSAASSFLVVVPVSGRGGGNPALWEGCVGGGARTTEGGPWGAPSRTG